VAWLSSLDGGGWETIRVMAPVEGQVVMVTGAARGIGAETARRLGCRGAHVALVGLEPEELERVAGECGPDAAWFEADVTDRGAIQAAVEGAVERFGGLDALVANAGIASSGLVRYSDPNAFERTIEVNLLGSYRTIYAALPHIVERRGYVMQIASVAAFSPAPTLAAYGASKAGVEAMCNALRIELGPSGVGVGVAYFFWIGTDLVSVGRDGHPALGTLSKMASGPLGKTRPASTAADAIVRGIERRSRTVVVPRWFRGGLILRGVLPQLVERRVRSVMPDVEAEVRADVEARGAESSRPVGPGGDAAMRAIE
jgi:NAD(P)-dependent dehydrogenase (short-subunit alcohol dehydrogenase family)